MICEMTILIIAVINITVCILDNLVKKRNIGQKYHLHVKSFKMCVHVLTCMWHVFIIFYLVGCASIHDIARDIVVHEEKHWAKL